MNTEPVAVAAAVRAVLVVAIGFGLDMDTEQLASIVVAVELNLALFTRSQVTPNLRAMQNERNRRVRPLRARR